MTDGPSASPEVWLLELGDGWAIAMIVTGLFSLMAAGAGTLKALWPRLDAGPRILVRDLHACIAVGIVTETGSGASGGSDSMLAWLRSASWTSLMMKLAQNRSPLLRTHHPSIAIRPVRCSGVYVPVPSGASTLMPIWEARLTALATDRLSYPHSALLGRRLRVAGMRLRAIT
jgi:uncharacterized iron-regulated membrane protein